MNNDIKQEDIIQASLGIEAMGPPNTNTKINNFSNFLSPDSAHLSRQQASRPPPINNNNDEDEEEEDGIISFPAPTSYQRAAGSNHFLATTSSNPNNDNNSIIIPTPQPSSKKKKVVLLPGHSPMDWAKFKSSSSSVNLRGSIIEGIAAGGLLKISLSELAKHKSKDDLWICVRGKVYNCTCYVDYHPGGVKQILRGGGIEATELFNKVHPWVNIEILLDKCLLGFLVG